MSDYRNKKIDLISYYPEFLQENLEFNAICEASNPEYDLIWERLKQIELNILPQTADKDGIAQYEQWLGLENNSYQTLETRRAQVITKLNETLPYTEIRLQRILAATVGWGHFFYERHGAFVRVLLDPDSGLYVIPVRDMLERILPMNLHFEVVLRSVEAAALIDFAVAGQLTTIIETPINIEKQTGHIYHGQPYLESAVIETK